MKKFFKTTFACVLGTLIAGLILVLIFTVMLVGVTASSVTSQEKPFISKANSVLKIELSGTLQERYEEDVNFDPAALLNQSGNESSVGLDQFRKALDAAANDKNIVGIYIDAKGLSAMPASIEQVRNMLVEFKEKSGKWIYSYADNYAQGDYVLASVADTVILNPIGSVNIHGLGGMQMFFPVAFKKLGVEMKIFRVGTYKSAVEPYMGEKMSPANREQTLAYLNTIWDTYTAGVTASRGFTAEHFNNVANTVTSLLPTKEVLAMNLVDTLMYRPQFNEWLKAKVGVAEDEEINFATVAQLASAVVDESQSKNTIAVVYAVGDIMESGGGINSDDLVPELTKLRKDENIKAVVLRVNSPGGSAYASEQIWAELEAIKAAGKKLIVSMSDMAASGGYYISCGADRIFAENTTLTGSIGVFGTMPVAKELVQDKLGLRFDGAFTHEGGNPFSSEALYCGINENQAMAIQRNVENTYDLFTRRCAEGRGMSQDDIKKIAEGRVWIGKTAAEIGLVDEIGSIEDAIAYAAEACELEDYKV
ncbi:MAG: signal peptide peptidase SppA, partial [Bacteroidaceae bacterium]|nr:signal peptide peptidase SppA [Bacteroidaceae bacterium]